MRGDVHASQMSYVSPPPPPFRISCASVCVEGAPEVLYLTFWLSPSSPTSRRDNQRSYTPPVPSTSLPSSPSNHPPSSHSNNQRSHTPPFTGTYPPKPPFNPSPSPFPVKSRRQSEIPDSSSIVVATPRAATSHCFMSPPDSFEL